jgi:hypothetical protein
MSSLGGAIYILHGTRSSNVGSYLNTLLGVFVAWGLSLAWWVRWVVRGGGFCGCYFFYMALFCVQGAPPPLVVAAFVWLLIHLVLALLAFYLKNNKSNNLEDTKQGLRVHNPSIFT